MKCLNCSDDTPNPKFCSKSCSAIYNNKKFPKRFRIKKCKTCEDKVQSGYTFCKKCRDAKHKAVVEKNANSTIRELKSSGNPNFGGRYSYIRALSRASYRKSGNPMACEFCGYDLHVEICHRRDISDFPLDTKIRVVNSLKNLVALCKNHHWEFDHGVIEL